eukprot:12084469-Ditylum_brightwellii.AAC.1
MPVAQYTVRTGGVSYVDSPNYPGVYDATIANNTGQVVLSRREVEHKQHVDNHMIKKTIENIIKIMLDEVLPCWLLAKTEDRETGLNTNAEQPIPNTQLSVKGQLYDGQTGLFKDKYFTWKHRAIAMKTWNDFKTYWNQEFADYKTLSKLTSCEAGFGANAAVEHNYKQPI